MFDAPTWLKKVLKAVRPPNYMKAKAGTNPALGVSTYVYKQLQSDLNALEENRLGHYIFNDVSPEEYQDGVSGIIDEWNTSNKPPSLTALAHRGFAHLKINPAITEDENDQSENTQNYARDHDMRSFWRMCIIPMPIMVTIIFGMC